MFGNEYKSTELIPFILKYLPAQDLKKCHSINNIWQIYGPKERLFLILYYVIKNTVKNFYSKLEECNKSFGYSEEFLKCTLLKGLSPENKIFKVLMDVLQALCIR
jgi:hypothetical protein